MEDKSVRLDKWLWAVRIYKTRSDAADACRTNKVLVNGSYAKPSREVKPGDAITVKKMPVTYSFRVVRTRLVAAAGQGGPPLCRERHAARRARQAEHPEAEHFRPARPGQRKAHEARAPRDRLADGRALFRRRGRAVLNLYGTESHADTIRFRCPFPGNESDITGFADTGTNPRNAEGASRPGKRLPFQFDGLTF